MQVLLRAAFYLAGLRGAGNSPRIAVVVDSDTGISADTVTTLLHPWRSWLELTDVTVTGTDPNDAWFAMVAANGARTVSIVSERPDFTSPLEEAAHRHGLSPLGSGYPDDSGRTNALFHEMVHHHYELGGLNEWDGATVKYAPDVLQHISAANCIKYFPPYVLDDLRARYQRLGRPLQALDIGSGPISRLRWGALQGLLHVTGIDPLLDIYDVILTHHGLDLLPAIRVDRAINANAESLDRHVSAESVDFAFCCNALDHVEDPHGVIFQLAAALRPGALVALEFATREGSRQNWQDLHQFDLFLDVNQGEVMCQKGDGQEAALIPRNAPLVLDRVVVDTDDYTVVVLRQDGDRRRWRGPRFRPRRDTVSQVTSANDQD